VLNQYSQKGSVCQGGYWQNTGLRTVVVFHLHFGIGKELDIEKYNFNIHAHY
jgi:hypothetical protein